MKKRSRSPPPARDESNKSQQSKAHLAARRRPTTNDKTLRSVGARKVWGVQPATNDSNALIKNSGGVSQGDRSAERGGERVGIPKQGYRRRGKNLWADGKRRGKSRLKQKKSGVIQDLKKKIDGRGRGGASAGGGAECH